MIAIIPSCGASTHLPDVIRAAAPHCSEVSVVLNNLQEHEYVPFYNTVLQYGGTPYRWDTNIYDIWNWGILAGRAAGENVALLNDDIQFADHHSFLDVDRLLSHGPWAAIGWDYFHPDLRSFDRVREVKGTFRKKGIGGFAFAVHPGRVPLVQEGYNWWGGDDDLLNGAMAAGHPIGVAMGLGVRHDTSTSANARPEVYARVEQDRQLLLSRWGEAW